MVGARLRGGRLGGKGEMIEARLREGRLEVKGEGWRKNGEEIRLRKLHKADNADHNKIVLLIIF